MANRYWVGGSNTWDGTVGTKWATTSGGAGGASVPTTADDVFFTNLSTGTCTISAGNTGAKSINCTGFTGTITGTNGINVAGSITLSAGMTYSHTGTLVIIGTGTLTTAGKAFSGLTIDGVGITVTLGDALNISTRTFTVTNGNFNTANYNVTAGTFNASNSNVRTITFGSSTVTILNNSGFNFSVSTGLTFNANTSQITLSSFGSTFAGGSQTFYNVSFTGTAAGTRFITGANTFNNLTLNATGTGLSQFSISDNQIITGTLTCNGISATARGFLYSNITGTSKTITAATVSTTDCDFRDIVIAGAASPISPTRAGDCGGNSGITFPAAKTSYRVGTGINWTGTSSWALTSGGTGSDNNFPLPQDTAVIDNNTTLTGTLGFTTYNIGTIDFSTRTTGITLNHGAAINIYGSYLLGSGVTVSGVGIASFFSQGTQTFNSAGKTTTFAITVDAPSGTLQLGDALTSTNRFVLTRGTFNANNYNVTFTTVDLQGGLTKALTMGSGLWTLSGSGVVWNANFTNTSTLAFDKGTADFLLSNNTTTAREFSGAIYTYNKVTIGGNTSTSRTTFGDGNSSATYSEVDSTKTVAHTVAFNQVSGLKVTIGTWSVTGTAGNVVTVNSNVAGTSREVNVTNVTIGIDYLSVTDINITNTNKFYVGVNSTDGGNNTNVYFTASPSSGDLILETTTLTELITALLISADNVDESQTLTDAQLGTLTTSNDISETETLSHTQTASLTLSAALSETETLTDSLIGGLLFTAVVAETETLTSDESARLTAVGAVAESTSLSETQSATYVFVNNITESATLTDAQTGLAIYRSTVAESQVITEEQLGNMIYPSDISETETLTDEYDGQRSLYYAVTETTTLTNTQSATYFFAGNIVEAVDLTTTQDALAVFRSTQNESMIITDSIIGRGWFKINDGQVPDWQGINDAQGTGWVDVNASGDAEWIPVDDKQ